MPHERNRVRVPVYMYIKRGEIKSHADEAIYFLPTMKIVLSFIFHCRSSLDELYTASYEVIGFHSPLGNEGTSYLRMTTLGCCMKRHMFMQCFVVIIIVIIIIVVFSIKITGWAATLKSLIKHHSQWFKSITSVNLQKYGNCFTIIRNKTC